MDTYKVLGQVNPGATALTTLYTVPGGASAIGSTLVICNQSGAAGSFRVAVRPAGAAIDPKHYLFYDAPIGANDTIMVTIGLTLAATDVVSAYASSASMSFQIFGDEKT